MIRILIVDDHALFREGMRKVIEDWEEFEVVGVAQNGYEAISKVELLQPDIVLMDVDMPIMGGIEAVAQLHLNDPEVKCVMLTVSEDDDGLREAIEAGACGYILKDMPMKRFRSMLREVMNGEAPISGRMAAKAMRMMREGTAYSTETRLGGKPAEDRLTDREIELLRLLAEGKSNQEIAAKLYLSERTVKKNLNNLFVKINVANRVQAAVYAIKAGIS